MSARAREIQVEGEKIKLNAPKVRNNAQAWVTEKYQGLNGVN